MRIVVAAFAVGLLLTSRTSGAPIDLSQIDRTVRKESAYRSKPKYCLLVFGPKAKARVWLVLDGDLLYVDKNGNGDLTEEGERSAVPAYSPSTSPFCVRERSVDVSALAVGGLIHTDLVMRQSVYRRTVPGWQEHMDSVWRQVPDGIVYELSVDLDTRCYGLFTDARGRRVKHLAFADRQGKLVFADRLQDAPVIHFGGPLSLYLRPGEKLRRETDSEETTFWLGTPGRGAGTFAIMWHDLIPEKVHPVAQIQFPPKAPGQRPVNRKFALQGC